ncbi:hypothetical protein OsI_08427 [Oryza sativa Indica Group]|uniref:Uncharacterized protein n=1 Tax=Oryza sativa subsp. indica TaxID=39946 RepID=A2X867_ORYSI|nr:hypothetical protein OsI_08427 [Oryza sativa Indica Group]
MGNTMDRGTYSCYAIQPSIPSSNGDDCTWMNDVEQFSPANGNDRRNLRVQERNHPTLLNLVVVPFMSGATLIV